MEEEWKHIAGFPDYQVSCFGQVRSLRTNPPKILKQNSSEKTPYLNLTLCKDKKRYNKRVHCLVAGAFLPNLDNKKDVDHIDRNKHNNTVNNLRWVSRSENMKNTSRHDTEMYGIHWATRDKTYRVMFRRNGRELYIGQTTLLEKAKEMRNEYLASEVTNKVVR